MPERLFLTGNQAIARAVWESGVKVATSYPGSPATQLMEALAQYEKVYVEWSTSEKVALEVAMGASFGGARSFVSMKHVGINIASDPLMTFAYTRINGGFVLAVGDDPGMHSSQNEQDSRTWGPFGFMPILEPSNAGEAHKMAKIAFEISEKYETPVIVRLFDKTCHMAGTVDVEERSEVPLKEFVPNPNDYYMVPPFSVHRRLELEKRMAGLKEYSENSPLNYGEAGEGDIAVIASGHLYLYTKELAPKLPIFKVGVVYPLPVERIRAFAEKFKKVIVVEELAPFIEDILKKEGITNVFGKEYFKPYGEITPEVIHAGLTSAGCELKPLREPVGAVSAPQRTPMMCTGCPHRPVIRILKDLKVTCHGDIGCYLMGSYEPFNAFKTSTSMAASIGTSIGMEKAQSELLKHRPNVSVIGDSTFVHSGLPALANASYNGHTVKLVILDNSSTSMTGGQENPSTGKDIHGNQHKKFDYEAFCKVVGIEEVVKVDQFKYAETKKIMKEKLEDPAKSVVIIATRPCALKYKIQEPYFYVDPNVCIACRTCISVSCPPISMQQYPHKEAGKLNSFIDETMCVGCSVCSQVCPVGAIKRSEPGKRPEVLRPVGYEREE